RWACAGRSSRGTSRSSWRRGSSPPRLPAATPPCSSPPSRHRSPRSGSASCCRRWGCPTGGATRSPAPAPIVRHPLIDKVAFTGSTEVGKEIHRETASTLKRVSLELGGKSPNIVFADADVTEAVKGALVGVFFNQGEVCCAGTRLFVEEKVHDEFADAVAKAASPMKQDPGLGPGTQVGPLVSEEQLERVTGYLEIGKQEGAKVLTGGERNTAPGLEGGYFVKPTVFTGVRNDMRIAQEEIFGPVV